MTQPFRISVPAPFPSQVVGQNGIGVSKSGGVWSVGPSFPQVGLVNSPATSLQALLYDPATGAYVRSPISGIAPTAPIYMTPKVASLGDSNVNRGIWNLFPNNEDVVIGATFWSQFLSGYRVYGPVVNNLSAANDTTLDMLNKTASAIATGADTCIVWGGLRDILALVPVGPEATPGTVTNNLRTIYRNLINAGITVIAVTVLPSSGWSATQIKMVHNLNQWIKEQNNIRAGLHVVDCDLVISDVTSATYLGKAGYIATNLVNPSEWGAYLIGNQISNILKALSPDVASATYSQDDLYDAVNNPSGSLNANPMLTGTGGSVAGGATGTVATGWTVDAGGAGGATVTCSKVTLPDGRAAQRIVVSGTYTSNNARKSVEVFSPAVTLANVQVGDVLEGSGYVSIAAGSTNINSLPYWINSTEAFPGPGATNYQNYTNEGVDIADKYPTDATGPNVAVAGNLYVPRHLVQVAPTIVKFQFRINLCSINDASAHPCACTVDITSASLRKIWNAVV